MTSSSSSSSSLSHALELLPSAPYRCRFYKCNLCQENGSGPVWHCAECHFDLHPLCTASSQETTHFCHYEHVLTLAEASAAEVEASCLVCGAGLSLDGGVYCCGQCKCSMHPTCARAPRYLRHFSHQHVLCLVNTADTYSDDCWCDGCEQEISRFMYHCDPCKFDLHPGCVMLPDKPLLTTHPDHRIKLLTKSAYSGGDYTCDECGRRGKKWVYHCEPCGFDLHPHCARLSHWAPIEVASSNSNAPEESSKTELENLKELKEFLMAMKNVEPILQNMASSSTDVLTMNGSSANDGHDICPICLEGFDGENPKRKTKCAHSFHPVCILKWKETNDSCPICLKKIVFPKR